MPELTKQVIQQYLERLYRKSVQVLDMTLLGDAEDPDSIKEFGYGTPIKVEYEVDGEAQQSVFETVTPGAFGHEEMSDRAGSLLWSHRAFQRLPRHVRAIDVGGFHQNGSLLSVNGLTEFFLLVEFHEGEGYHKDLFRLQKTGILTDTDIGRSDALCDYLVQIHSVTGTTSSLYQRRIRELLGHGECIMGLTDSYPPDYSLVPPDLLERIEHLCLSWRWRLKNRNDRLCQVHGDFHPWNLLFRDGIDFSVLDRSRGEFGEAADDVTCLTMNYLFFSLQSRGELSGPFDRLFHRFWERYLENTGDQEILHLSAPFFAFRGLVMASPVWYPNLKDETREKIVAFILNVLESESFDPSRIHQYYRP